MAPSRGEAAAKHTAAQIPARPLQCGERIVADISPYYHHSVDQRDGAGSGDWLPRTLVILSGTKRGNAAAWNSLHVNLLQPARADLMLVISQVWLDQMQSNRSATFDADRANLLNKAKFVVGVHEYDHWDEALDEMEREGRSAHVGGEALPSWRIRLRALDCPNRGEALGGLVAGPTVQCRDMLALRSGSRFQGSAAIVGFYRWRAKRALQERRLIERYDAFVYTRVDIFFLCAWPTALPYWSSSAAPSGGGDGHPRVALIPQSRTVWDRNTGDPHDWGGLYDRFIVASRGAIGTALSTLEQWVVHDRPLSGVPSRPLHANAEVALQAALADGGVDVYRTPRRMLLVHAVAEANNGDRSRWSTCTLQSAPPSLAAYGLCAKACSEFVSAAYACTADRNASLRRAIKV